MVGELVVQHQCSGNNAAGADLAIVQAMVEEIVAVVGEGERWRSLKWWVMGSICTAR